MNTGQKSNMNKKIEEVLNRFVGSLNSPETRDAVAFQVKSILEMEDIDFTIVNVYTPPKRAKDGIIDIKVDDELYPFAEVEKIDENSWHDYIFKWEIGELTQDDTIRLFQYLIDEGHAWSLQGFYGRTAEDLIEGGYCTLSYKETEGYYVWGNPKIPSKYDLPNFAPGTEEYVQKRMELTDDEFIAWAGELV